MDHNAQGDTGLPLSSPLDGRYRILSRLGSGGMADVYLAQDESLGRLVAVKVLKAPLAGDREFVERFRIEAQAAASLNHRAIVAVYDRGRAGDSPYIVMEYVGGESLKQRLRREGRLDPDEAAAVALAVLSALRVAHEHHIVHRDVTPANVLIDEKGAVKVTDFGIARMGESALTRSGAMLGTTSYVSPEQAQGKPADERSDLYGLGVVLYQMLTGRLPFRGENDVAVALQHVSAAPPNPRSVADGVPEAYATVVMRALCKRPEDRYQSAAEFADALRAARAAGARRRIEAAGVAAATAPQRPPTAGSVAGSGAFTGAGTPTSAGAVSPAPAVGNRAGGPYGPGPVSSAGAPDPVSAAATSVFAGGPAAAPPVHTATVVAADARTRQLPPQARPAPSASSGAASPPPARRKRHTLRWLVVVLLLVLAAGAGWAVYAYVLNGGVTVPDLAGRDASQAAASLRADGFSTALHYVWSDRVDAGAVVRQRPKADSKVEKGVQVDLWVSKGPLHIPAPSLAGLTAKEANAELEKVQLTPRKRRSATLSAPKGKVYRQDPEGGVVVTRGDTVTYWVSSGPPVVTVPDVVGMTQEDATAVLEGMGLVVSIDHVFTLDQSVVGQDPAAGEQVRKGDEVVIQVSFL